MWLLSRYYCDMAHLYFFHFQYCFFMSLKRSGRTKSFTHWLHSWHFSIMWVILHVLSEPQQTEEFIYSLKIKSFFQWFCWCILIKVRKLVNYKLVSNSQCLLIVETTIYLLTFVEEREAHFFFPYPLCSHDLYPAWQIIYLLEDKQQIKGFLVALT